jgi:hypothetical protein
MDGMSVQVNGEGPFDTVVVTVSDNTVARLMYLLREDSRNLVAGVVTEVEREVSENFRELADALRDTYRKSQTA